MRVHEIFTSPKQVIIPLYYYENRPKYIVKVLRFWYALGFKLIVSQRIHIPNLNEFWMRVHEILTSPGQVRILLHYYNNMKIGQNT